MRALVLDQPGRPPVLAVKDIPTPAPGPGEALVRVAACGFCHHDLLVMAGVLRRGVKPQVVLGHEISGVVVEVGNGVDTVKPGDPVVSILTNACGQCDRCRQGREHRCRYGEGIGHGRDGGFAEYVAVSAASLVPVPDAQEMTGAALFACPMGVALQSAQEAAQVRPGEWVVVTGAGGGLGVHAVQVAVAMGGRVLAVTSSPEKGERLTQLGAEQVLEAGPAAPGPGHSPSAGSGQSLDFSELVMALTGDQGADVVIDTVGSPLFPSTFRCLGQFGRLALLGEVSGQPVRLDLAEVIFRDARILGSSGVSRGLVQQVAGMVSAGRLKPVVDRVLPLEQAANAFQLVSSRKVLGRVVLTAR